MTVQVYYSSNAITCTACAYTPVILRPNLVSALKSMMLCSPFLKRGWAFALSSH